MASATGTSGWTRVDARCCAAQQKQFLKKKKPRIITLFAKSQATQVVLDLEMEVPSCTHPPDILPTTRKRSVLAVQWWS